ncbi:MAG TPA: YHS domain-containing protein, partial [Pyrinomonadaceae bacterium]|nr:YHS domain-containing protein [Pyrinomonadaceae bacterium]
MEAAAAKKEEFVDPVCGMTVNPETAAGTSERDGVRYYFCSTGCKEKFDAGTATAGAPAHEHHAAGHAQHGVAATPRAAARAGAHDAGADAEKAQAESYRTMMRKFWFATAVGLPLLLLMFAEFVPSLRHALMPYHRLIGVVSAVVTLPVLAWSGRHFFESAWNGLLNHNTNMDTLVALGTGAAWAYSTVAVLAPGLFPAGTAGMYFEVAVIVIALILLGQALEMRAKSRSSAAIKKLLELQAKTARVIRQGREMDVPVEEVVVGDT